MLGIGLLTSFIALLSGSLLAMRAAFGWPPKAQLLTGQVLTAHDRNEVNRARCSITWARRLLVAGLITNVVAVGALFTNPAKPGSVVVRVKLTNSHTTCGGLLDLSATEISVVMVSELGKRTTVLYPMSDVAGLHVVGSC
ncbi:MAG: hypothetical protein JO214_10180 [Frankiaceae bacterium]|nr:hypothetical protein [Frankiaceae bacterium]